MDLSCTKFDHVPGGIIIKFQTYNLAYEFLPGEPELS